MLALNNVANLERLIFFLIYNLFQMLIFALINAH